VTNPSGKPDGRLAFQEHGRKWRKFFVSLFALAIR